MRGRAAVSSPPSEPLASAARPTPMAARGRSIVAEALVAGGSKRDRQRAIRELVVNGAISSQQVKAVRAGTQRAEGAAH